MAETRIPTIGITMGDPAGIGPEIVCRSLTEPAVYDVCRPVVIGSRAALEKAAAAIGSHQRIQAVNDPADAVCSTQVVNVIDLPLDYDFQPGVMDVGNGRAAISYMEQAYATAVVLLVMVLLINGLSSLIAKKFTRS